MNIKIINSSTNPLPSYSTLGSSGMDLRANIVDEITLAPLQRILVKTGIFIELPIGFEAQIRPRSGLAYKHGITVLNSPGTIDPDYRGEVGVILINLSSTDFSIKNGDRIAQMVVSAFERVEWSLVDKLADSSRANRGFGSTGIK